jgi:hypothetical protein
LRPRPPRANAPGAGGGDGGRGGAGGGDGRRRRRRRRRRRLRPRHRRSEVDGGLGFVVRARRDLVQTRLLRGDFRERRRGRDRRLGRQATLLRRLARLARRADPLHREIRALERQRQRVVVAPRGGRSRSARPGSRPSPSRTRWSS